MKVLLLLPTCVFGYCLCFGGAAGFEVQELGGGGIMSVPVSMPTGLHDVFDFSKDGRCIWLSETNCYDLAGHQLEVGKLGESSSPLTRMGWKNKFIGADINYPFREIMGRITSDMKAWLERDGCGRKIDLLYCHASLTFPPASDPVVAAYFWPKGGVGDFVSIARFGENGEIGFGRTKKIEFTDPIANLDFSPDRRHFVMMQRGAQSLVFQIKIMRADLGSDVSAYTDNSIMDVISVSELEQLLGEKWLLIRSGRGHGFANENYYVFACNRGGRSCFTARDYFVVYGLREKRIVKVFKSRLRWLDEGWPMRDTDFALSADEKYLAIRYDGEITVYPFNQTTCQPCREK